MLSLRLEKSIGIWNAQFTQQYTPTMAGLDKWIDWNKPDFIGKNAALNAIAADRILTMLKVDAHQADPAGFEPVWHNNRIIGIPTSGGYGHQLKNSMPLPC